MKAKDQLANVKKNPAGYYWHLLVLAPPLLVLLIFLVLNLTLDQVNSGPTFLLPLLNTLFMGIVSLSTLSLFLWQVKRIGSWQILLLVNGIFIYGIASLIAGWAYPFGGQNLVITVHNLGALLASVSLCGSSVILIISNTSVLLPQPKSRSYYLLSGSLALLLCLTILSFMNVVPPFFPVNDTPTPLRQSVIIISGLLFMFCTVNVFTVFYRSRVNFLFWYACGLLMITLGILLLPFIQAISDPLTLLGRSFQYIGCIYLGISIYSLVKESRTKQTPVTYILDEYLAQSRVNFQLLVDSLKDAVILVDNWGRILSWNRAAESVFGYQRNQAIGANAVDLIFENGNTDDFRPDLLTFLGLAGEISSENTFMEYSARRKDGSIFPCELTVTRSQSGSGNNKHEALTLVIRDTSENQKSREALEASETRLRLALSNAPVMVAAQDRDLRYLWAYNQNTWQQADVVGKSDGELFEPEDAQTLTRLKRQVLESGSPARRQIWLNSQNQKRFIDLYLEPIKDRKGQLIGTGIAMVDLTPMKTAEESLKINNEKLSIISEAGQLLLTSDTPETIIKTIAERVISHVNGDCFFNFLVDMKASRLYLNAYGGISEDEVSGLRNLDYYESMCGCVARDGRRIISSDVQHNGDNRLETLRSLGVQAYACFPLLISQGTRGTLSFGTRKRTAFNADELDLMGAVTNLVSIALERQLIADFLRQNEEMFRSLAENSLDVISRFDADGRILYINPAGLKIAGSGAQDYPGKKIDEFDLPPNFGGLWKEKREELLHNKRPAILEYSSYEKGEEIFFQTLLTPELSTDGSVKSFVSSTRNITELKKMEQMKDEFIGMVSHELKTPLTVIIGSLAVAKTRGLPAEQVNELITDAALYADDLVVIVDNLLELSRFQSHRLTIQSEPVDPGLIARNVVQKLKNKSGKHILKMEIPLDSVKIRFDKVRLERVLYNLVENAIKYSPAGGEVRLFSQIRDNMLVIGVSDQGLGIAEEDVPRLFQRFERIEAYEKHIIPGLGLGLRVCRILVEAHGGKIWVESKPGQGTTFYFSVPIVS